MIHAALDGARAPLRASSPLDPRTGVHYQLASALRGLAGAGAAGIGAVFAYVLLYDARAS